MKKLIKYLSLPALAIFLSPGLASCSNISQWFLPVVTGGAKYADGPFDSTDNSLDYEGNAFSSYLPYSYLYSYDANGNVPYAYCAPNKVVANPESTSAEKPTFDQYEWQWVQSGDEKLSFSYIYTQEGEGNKAKYFIDSRNWNTTLALSSVNSISYNISSLLAEFQFYQLHIVNNYLSNPEATQEKLNKLYGGNFNFGSKGDGSFQEFFEYNFSLANVLSGSKSHIKFGQQSSDFKFSTNVYGPAYYIKQENKDAFVDTKTLNPYAITKTDEESGELSITSYHQIPVLLNDVSLAFSFYDPTNSSYGIEQDKYLINDLDKVNESIKNSSSWNNFEKITGVSKAASTLSWNIQADNSATQISNLSIRLDGEPTLSQPDIKSKITKGSFFCLANYSYQELKDEDGNVVDKFAMPTGISGVYPSYFLQDDEVFVEDETQTGRYFLDSTVLNKKFSELVSNLTARDTDPTVLAEFATNMFNPTFAGIYSKI